MQIYCGTDIIEVKRIQDAIENTKGFKESIYTKNEIANIDSIRSYMKYQRYAGRFAAKEAVFKAISEFVNGREDALWKNIEVLNNECGKPYINVDKLRENISKTVDDFTLESIDVSLSHVGEVAVASAVLVAK